MVLSQPVRDVTRSSLLNAILEDESRDLVCTGFDEALVEALITVLRDRDGPPTVHLLTTKSVLRWVRDDFDLASKAADLVKSGTLSIQTEEGALENQLVISDGSVVSLVTAGEHLVGLPADHKEFVGAVNEKWNDRWNRADEFSLRTPGCSQIEESLNKEFGSEVETDFQAMLEAVEGTRSDENLNVVDICLLVAAKHELLLYDISKWGENLGVASKATFSRGKNNLEENGLIKTEKVPIDVGRPRLRLLFGKDELENADIDQLPSVAQRLLSGAT